MYGVVVFKEKQKVLLCGLIGCPSGRRIERSQNLLTFLDLPFEQVQAFVEVVVERVVVLDERHETLALHLPLFYLSSNLRTRIGLVNLRRTHDQFI